MFERFSTLLVGSMRGMSRMLGNEIAVVITPHKIKLRAVDPDRTDKSWDESHFVNGNIFFEGFANPFKPQYPDTEEDAEETHDIDMISSDRYKKFMEQNLISDIIAEGEDGEFPTMMHVLLLSGFMHLATISVIVYMMI